MERRACKEIEGERMASEGKGGEKRNIKENTWLRKSSKHRQALQQCISCLNLEMYSPVAHFLFTTYCSVLHREVNYPYNVVHNTLLI